MTNYGIQFMEICVSWLEISHNETPQLKKELRVAMELSSYGYRYQRSW